MKFYIASDHAGFGMKEFSRDYLISKGYEVVDLGPDSDDRVDYPDFAQKCAKAVVSDKGSFGVLICGTGIGISISANRVAGVRAGLCHNAFTATATRAHNDANILCYGARVVGLGVVESMLDAFCKTEFEGGRHSGRVAKIENCSMGTNL